MKRKIFWYLYQFCILFIILFFGIVSSCKLENYSFTEKELFTFDENLKIEKVLFIDDELNIVEIQNSELVEIEITNQSFTLEISQNQLTPILVYLEGEIYPHGVIYPYSKKITRTDGFSAKILFRFLNETQSSNKKLLREYIAHFNWEKFSEKVGNYENPWELNQEIILKDLAAKTFSAKSFQLLK